MQDINLVKVKGKMKLSRYRIKKRPDWKKAYVKLKPGEKTPEFLEGT